VHPASDGYNIGIVMLATELGSLNAPGKCSANSLYFIGSNLFAIT